MRYALAIACTCLLAPRPALADPVFLVAGGSISMGTPGSRFQEASMHLNGAGLSVFVVDDWFGLAGVNSLFVGETVDLSTTVQPGGWGSARVGANSYEEVNFSGSLRFDTTPFIAQDTGASEVSTAFTMMGQLLGHYRSDPTRLAFSVDLRGGGTISILDLVRFPPDGSNPAFYSTHRAVRLMTFADSPAPVPEPGTLLLFAAGAAAAARLRRRPLA